MNNTGNRHMYFKRFITLILLLFSPLLMAEITVKVDRDPVVADESFQIIFESDKKIDVKPDFSALKQSFTVLDSRHRSNTQIINGNISYSQTWVVSVIANKTGKVIIPPIKFGKETTRPAAVKVVAASKMRQGKGEDVFIEVSVDTKAPYVQAQLIYTVKLYLSRTISTNNASLTDPELTGGRAVINKLGEDKSFETQRNGKRYAVIQRQYVIFPQSSGAMTVQPVMFKGQTGGAGGFFNFDPFGPQPRAIIKRSESIDINVKPIPDSFIGDTWLPAKAFTLQEAWSVDPSKLTQGEATTRTLTLTASGLAASHLPGIESKLPGSLKQYPDQPEFEESNNNNGYVGIRRDKMAIIPTQAGEVSLPAVEVPWWNTVTDKMEIAELPERFIHAAVNPAAAVSNVPDVQQASPDNETAIVADVETEPVLNEGQGNADPIWKWMSVLFFMLWLVTLVLLFKRKDKTAVDQTNTKQKESARQYLKQIQQACRNNEADKVKQALLQWASSHWPEESISSLNAIKEYSDDAFKIKLDELNQCLYGNNASQWDGKSFLSVFEGQSFKKKKINEKVGRLEPLYKT